MGRDINSIIEKTVEELQRELLSDEYILGNGNTGLVNEGWNEGILYSIEVLQRVVSEVLNDG